MMRKRFSGVLSVFLHPPHLSAASLCVHTRVSVYLLYSNTHREERSVGGAYQASLWDVHECGVRVCVCEAVGENKQVYFKSSVHETDSYFQNFNMVNRTDLILFQMTIFVKLTFANN